MGRYGSPPPTEEACEDDLSEPESSVWNFTLRMLCELRVPLRWKLPCLLVPADITIFKVFKNQVQFQTTPSV